MPRLRHAITVVRAVSVLVLAAPVSGVLLTASGAEAAGPITVTVSNTAVGTLSTQVSTNNVWSGMLAQSATASANFKALAMPLVRIHVGDDGYPIAMPETKKGIWSFASLDTLVNDSFKSGQAPLMNIKFAPDWQWTCTTLYTQGTVRDQTFVEYADYMARLVSYYNKGSMTTESGVVITNPAGTSHRIIYWEPWNEPDLNNETPCAPASGVALTPTQYVTMWNAVTARMLAVDPGLRFIGPATAGGQFGSGTDPSQDYFTPLLQQSIKPFALSFHGYGYWDNTVSDQTIFNGDGSGYPDGGIDDMVTTTNRLRSSFPTTPIWLDEMNVNADWGSDTHKRPWTQFSAAWWGATYAALAPLHVEMLHQYNVMDAPQFGLLNDQTGAPFLPYWEFKLLNQSFPVGSTQLQSSSPSTNIPVVSAARADGTISIMVVNRTVDPSAPAAGIGLPADVVVSLSGMSPTAITVQQIDSATSVTSGPVVTSLPVSSSVSLHFPGYGLAVITVTQGPVTPVPPSNTTAPVVTGTPQVGQTLTASQGTWNGGPTSFSHQWQSATTSVGPFADIAGATSNSFAVTSAQQFLYLRAVVTASNAQGSSAAPSNVVGPVTAVPVPVPSVSLTPASVSFASQAVGASSAAQTVTVKNSGDAPLTITSLATTGANASDFAQTTTCPLAPSTLAATASCTVAVTFTPSAVGTRTASVTITDNAGSGSQDVSLTGDGFAATTGVAVTPTSLKFGRQTMNTRSSGRLITFKNNGTVPVTISTIAVTGKNPGDFEQSSDCLTSNALPSGASCVISVIFTPGTAGKRNASITITHSASTSVATIALTGTGVYLADGFESGTLAGWTVADAFATAQTSIKHNGSYAAALTPSSVGGAVLSAPLVALGQTQTWTRFYFRYAALAGTVPIAYGVDGAGMKLWQIDFVASRTALRVTLWNGAGLQTSFNTSTGSFAPNEWNSVELRFKAVKSGYAELWENGTSMGAITANLYTASPYSRLYLANTAGSAATYYDDVVVSSLYNGTA